MFRQQMTRLIAINFRCRHWLAWSALLLSCALAAFGSISKERNTYDNLGQLRTAYGKESGGVTNRLNEQFSYGYDAAWNLTARTNNALTQSFTNSSRNQLTGISRGSSFTLSGNTTTNASSVTVNGSAAIRYADYSYAKDGLTLTNGSNSYTVIAQDSSSRKDTNVITANLPSSVTFTHDSNGNLTSDGLRGLDYDDENQLIRITVTNSWKSEYVYDGLGRRRVRQDFLWWTNSGSATWAFNTRVWYLYDGNVVTHERWDGDEPPVNYTRGLDVSGSLQGAGGIGGLLARSQNVSGVPQHQYYHADGNGNVTAMINASQQVTARYLYDPFGRVLASSGPMADVNLYRFSSKEAHDNSGLVYYGLRFYDPSLQRWLNGDPLREGGGINLFRFCGGDPINRIDPWGLADTWWDETAEYWGNRAEISKQYLFNSTPTIVATVGATILDIGYMIPSIPKTFAEVGTGSGTFIGNPTLENSAGAFLDLSTVIGVALPLVPKAPLVQTAPKVNLAPPPAPIRTVPGAIRATPPQPPNASVGLETGGLRPLPGTRQIPEGIPVGWRIRPTQGEGGTWYYDPANKGNAVRVMQGDPASPFPNSQAPYVRWQKNGQALDINGNVIPKNTPAAHIPLQDFKFNPKLFK